MNLNRTLFYDRVRKSDEGVTIIEVLAALTLLAIVTAGAAPLFVSGLRASLASKFETQAKNVAQERLEAMRNLPFYTVASIQTVPDCLNPGRANPLDAARTSVECDYKDLLDTYYRSAVTHGTWNATTGAVTGGYVGDPAGRSIDEAAAGLAAPYYRYVVDPVPDFEQGRFSQVVLSQFLNESRTPVVPATTYNTQNSNTDFPPSRLLGVTIITRWKMGSLAKKYVTFSQIAEGASEPTLVTAASEATALTLRSGLDFANTQQIEALAGISKAQATLAGAASTSTYAQGGYAALVPGQRMDGAYKTDSTPPKSSSTGGSSGISLMANVLADPTGAQYQAVLLRETKTSNVTVSESHVEPSVPFPFSDASFSTGSLRAESPSLNLLPDLVFNNGGTRELTSILNGGMYALHPVENLAWVRGSGPEDAAKGQTSVETRSASGAHFAKSKARASAQEVHLLPTAFAPDGLIKIELTSAQLTCKSPSPDVDASFTGKIKYYKSSLLGGGYEEIPFTSGGTALPDPASIQVSSVPSYFLSDYIRSWSILSTHTETTGSGQSANAVSGSLDGIVRITTRNTRIGRGSPVVPDDASAIDLRVGILSCTAEDKRT